MSNIHGFLEWVGFVFAGVFGLWSLFLFLHTIGLAFRGNQNAHATWLILRSLFIIVLAGISYGLLNWIGVL